MVYADIWSTTRFRTPPIWTHVKRSSIQAPSVFGQFCASTPKSVSRSSQLHWKTCLFIPVRLNPNMRHNAPVDKTSHRMIHIDVAIQSLCARGQRILSCNSQYINALTDMMDACCACILVIPVSKVLSASSCVRSHHADVIRQNTYSKSCM